MVTNKIAEQHDRTREVPFCNHYNNEESRQESSMDTKPSGRKLEEEEDIYIASKYCPTNHLLITKERTVTGS